MPTEKGYFITLEGCEGSGKSTQLQLLKEYLEKSGRKFAFTREPGGTPISEQIRRLLLDGKNVDMCNETEALLYAASRAQLVKTVILPSLAEGITVVCDRYLHSSLAYQAYARGLGFDFVYGVNRYAVDNCTPDVTLFLDIPPRRAFARKGGADAGDRIEQSGIEFHEKVYGGYLALAEKFPDRFVKINAEQPPEKVFEDILSALESKNVFLKK